MRQQFSLWSSFDTAIDYIKLPPDTRRRQSMEVDGSRQFRKCHLGIRIQNVYKAIVTVNQRQMHLRVEGMVQGVCFRYYTQTQATALGLSGWVRNRPDGSVEIIAEGETEALEQLREWCTHGPPHARVTAVKCELRQTNEHFSSFTITG